MREGISFHMLMSFSRSGFTDGEHCVYKVAHSIPWQMFCIIKLSPKTCCVDRFMHENKIPMGNLRKCYIKILGFFVFCFIFLFSQMFHLDYGPVIYGDHCSKCLSSNIRHLHILFSFFSSPKDLRNKSNPPPRS